MSSGQVGSHHLRVGANRRDEVIHELRASAATVLSLLVSILDNIEAKGYVGSSLRNWYHIRIHNNPYKFLYNRVHVIAKS